VRELALAAVEGRALVELVRDPIIGMDRNRRIVLWNRAAHATYGFTSDAAIGKPKHELLQTRFPIPLTEIEEAVLDTGHWSGTLIQTTKDGRELTIEGHWVTLADHSGHSIGTLAIDRDVTDRVEDATERAGERLDHARLEVQLERSQRLESVGQLAGGIAHDFNNILGVIINYSAFVAGELRLLADSTGEPRWASMYKDVGQIEIAAERAARLVHQLLAFSRQDIAAPVVLDLNDAIRDLEELLRRTIGEHVKLSTSLAPHVQPIRADAGQLQQVLVDVAVNSRDAMPDGGTLTIDTEDFAVDEEYALLRPGLEPGAYVRLRVSDTGAGMAPEILAHAFDPFFTTKPIGQGTGLGLASVYGIVARLGGRAQLYSEPGVGTTFSALIPVADDQTPLRQKPPQPESVSGSETILLVEDEDALRKAIERILAGAGYRVIVAAGGVEALALAEAYPEPINLLLTDLVMPGMLGNRLAEQLSVLRPALRIAYMSGFAEPFLDQSMHLDVAGLIEKPFTASSLLARLRTTLDEA
jgi:PAS domain S-box-containing protein